MKPSPDNAVSCQECRLAGAAMHDRAISTLLLVISGFGANTGTQRAVHRASMLRTCVARCLRSDCSASLAPPSCTTASTSDAKDCPWLLPPAPLLGFKLPSTHDTQ